MLVRAEADKVAAAAKDLAAKGLDALKNIDKEKAKELAGQAVNVVKSIDVEKAKAAAATAKDAAVKGYNVSVIAITGCLDAALAAWGKFDADEDGKLSINEAVALLNSEDLSSVVTKLTGMEHSQRTVEDIKIWFNRADFDKSNTLSKREFTVMYVGLLAHKAKLGLGTLAGAIATALDSDGDGKIGSTELKALLQGTPLKAIAGAIPDGKDVDYRALLGSVK